MSTGFHLEPTQEASYASGTITSKERTKYLIKAVDEAVAILESAVNNMAADGSAVQNPVATGTNMEQGGGLVSVASTCYAIHDLRLCDCCTARL